MRTYFLVILSIAGLCSIAGCGSERSYENDVDDLLMPSSTRILHDALDGNGISPTDFVEMPPDGRAAAWALIPGMKNCPVRLVSYGSSLYIADKLQKPDGSFIRLTNLGLREDPEPQHLTAHILRNPEIAKVCRGDDKAPPPHQHFTDTTPPPAS